MEKQELPGLGKVEHCDQIPSAVEQYIVELECQIRNLNLELDSLRPLSKLALIDSMTGLSNRRYFDMRLEAEQKQLAADPASAVSILVLDLDNLKIINDSYGHAAGDLALKGVAEAIERVLRPEDVCCRIGGDELAVIASGCEPQIRKRLIERLRIATSRVEGPWPDGLLRMSAGGATSTEDGTDLVRLVALADERMYEDKWKNKRSAPWQQLFRAQAGTDVTLARVMVSGWAWAAHTMEQQRKMWMNRATAFSRTL